MRTTDTDRLGDEIAELAAHLDAARRCSARRGFPREGRFAASTRSSPSPSGTSRASRRPLVDDALRRGRVSHSKVRALTRVATPASEAALLDMARSSTASQLCSGDG